MRIPRMIGATAMAIGLALSVAVTGAIAQAVQALDIELYVQPDVVNVRAQPTTDADIVAKMSKGDAVTVVGRTGDWYVAQLPGRRTGYVLSTMLGPKTGAAAPPAATTAQAPRPATTTPAPVAAAAPTPAANAGVAKPGQSFRDCADGCPEMVVVPAGKFTMGSPANEPDRQADQGPTHTVTFARNFAVGRFEVTFAEWDACVAAGGCGGYRPDDNGWGRGNRPVVGIGWDDAKAYVAWLSQKAQRGYRLLSEAEWEYAARAGTTTMFATGNAITTAQANFNGKFSTPKGEDRGKTVPVGTFAPNAFGLSDMHGNVSEWVEDCFHATYTGAPVDGGVWTANCADTGRILRGGSFDTDDTNVRAAHRAGDYPDARGFDYGFRIARTL